MAGRGQQEDWDIRLHDSAGLPFAPEPAQSQTETRVLNPWANLSEASPLPLSWHSHGLSDKGKRRSINEDAFLERSDIGLWAVADGMGGHYAGDKASQCVIAALAEIGDSDGLDSLLDQVRVRIQEANRKLRDLALATTEGGIIGSTVVVFLAQWDGCAVAWAGDSRLYRFRDGKLTQLTQDHALMVEGNQSQLMGGGNIVTRAVGAEADIELEIFRFLALKGDMYLLCSDGLPKELGVEEIAAHLRSGSCVDGACGLIAAGLEKEGRDNITVILACPEMQPVSET
jgi:serine/threonine protein phosphatase PrpC